MQVVAISSWLNFGHHAPPGTGFAAGRNFLAPPTTASVQCLRLSERFFIFKCFYFSFSLYYVPHVRIHNKYNTILGARWIESKTEIRQVQTTKLTGVNTTQGQKVNQPEHKLETDQEQTICTNIPSAKTETTETWAAVQTRAMVVKENKPPKPFKISSVQGLDIGPEELKVEQKADETSKY